MTKIVSIHSYRGGTGKSNTAANLASLLALAGQRVAIVDTDILSPGVHVLFGLSDENMGVTLNDYLWGTCAITDAAHDVTERLPIKVPGKLFLVPASIKAREIAKILREGYDVDLLNGGFSSLARDLKLDVLIIDTHPGLNEETLLSIAISDVLILVLRPDQQDYQGTGVTVQVARKLGVPNLLLLVNKCPPSFKISEVQGHIETAYNCEVVGVLKHSDEIMTLASGGVFVLTMPDLQATQELKRVVERIQR